MRILFLQFTLLPCISSASKAAPLASWRLQRSAAVAPALATTVRGDAKATLRAPHAAEAAAAAVRFVLAADARGKAYRAQLAARMAAREAAAAARDVKTSWYDDCVMWCNAHIYID
jgi:hypothetical protein